MAESSFLAAIATFLQGVGLTPTPASVGVAEPAQNLDLPAIVLSLEEVHRLGPGLGQRSAMITDGALPWTATIALANPFLPEEPGFNLLSADRRTLTLPHGGLRRADGSGGALGPADLSVTVAGAARTVVDAPPAANEVRADPLVGQLLFGAPLPPTGDVVANYVLGQWERRVTPIAGTLRVDVRGATPGEVAALSSAAVDALMAAPLVKVRGLRTMTVSNLSSIGPPDPLLAASRGRTARFSFDFEEVIDRPDSSGGVILRLTVLEVDKPGGAVVESFVVQG